MPESSWATAMWVQPPLPAVTAVQVPTVVPSPRTRERSPRAADLHSSLADFIICVLDPTPPLIRYPKLAGLTVLIAWTSSDQAVAPFESACFSGFD